MLQLPPRPQLATLRTPADVSRCMSTVFSAARPLLLLLLDSGLPCVPPFVLPPFATAAAAGGAAGRVQPLSAAVLHPGLLPAGRYLPSAAPPPSQPSSRHHGRCKHHTPLPSARLQHGITEPAAHH